MCPSAGNRKASLETSSWPWAGRQKTRGHLSCSLQRMLTRATLDSWFTSNVNEPLLTDLMLGLIYLCLHSLYIHSYLPSAPCLLGLTACDSLSPFTAYPEVFPFFLTIVLTVVCPIITRYPAITWFLGNTYNFKSLSWKETCFGYCTEGLGI